MYEECGYFDQHDSNPVAAGGSCSGINIGTNRSRFDDNLRLQAAAAAAAASSLEELTGQHMNASFAGIDQHLQHQLGLDLGQDFHGYLIQEASAAAECNWNPMVVPADATQEDAHHTDLRIPPYAPDLLSFLHLPRQPPPPPTPNFTGSPSRKTASFPVDIFSGEILGVDGGSAALYDAASVQLGCPAPAPHLLRDLFHPLPPNYGLFYGVSEREAAAAADIGGGGLVFRDGEAAGHYEDAMFEVRRDGRAEGNGAGYTNIEKQRREQLGEKFKLLKSLVPNPTKNDRASTLSDAIAYINELKRTIEELTILVDAKRYARSRKRGKTEEEEPAPAPAPETEVITPSMGPPRDDDAAAYRRPAEGALRSSWIQRRSRETFVDVRIVDDDVNIKMTRRKRPSSCLLSASKAIEEELQLELLHVSEGHIGDSHIFVFNTKISEGSYVYASAVAKKLLEAVDRPCSAVPARH